MKILATKRIIKAASAVMVLIIFLLFISWSGWGEFFIWQFDSLRGWELRVETQIPEHTVTLIQEPGSDFYNSYFEIKRGDRKKAIVLIDGDDRKWRNAQVIEKNRKIYFVRNFGNIGDRTSFIDPENNLIYSGYYQRTYRIDDLDFKASDFTISDFTPKPFTDQKKVEQIK